MPRDGYFFEGIVRQEPIDEDRLDPADNLEEYRPASDEDLDYLEREVERAAATGREVVASGFRGTMRGGGREIPADQRLDSRADAVAHARGGAGRSAAPVRRVRSRLRVRLQYR